MVSQTRRVSGFDQISLHAQRYNELVIKQGEQESLTIEAPKDILKRIETTGRVLLFPSILSDSSFKRNSTLPIW